MIGRLEVALENADIAMAFIGLMLTLALPYELRKQQREEARRTARASGTVVGVKLDMRGAVGSDTAGSSTPVGTYRAVVEYQVAGQRHQVVAAHGVSWRKPTVGAAARVHYNPAQPTDASVYSATAREVEHLLRVLGPLVGAVLLGVVLLRALLAS